MVTKERFLVVVSVLEGRKFPKRAKHELIVEARFDGELLSTDPVEHVESPDFTQELAWELDKKGLHQHKMQRTSIKVQVYARDTSSTMKESIGYVVMDLRSAQNKQQAKWFPLLHSKYSKSKPEVNLAIYIDDDKGQADGSFRAKKAPPREVDVGPSIDPKLLKPVLNDVEGYYQIGPGESCNEYFVLSVTVSFAENLPQLIPTNIALPSSGYFFYYSVLGNDVTNDVFYDIIHPNFPPERASVRIRSNVEALRAFLISQPGVEVHLCCGDQSLGSAEVSLKTLLKKSSSEIYMKPVKAEGAFQLIPPKRAQEQLPSVADNLRPTVGVSVVLRKEDVPQSSQQPHSRGEAQKTQASKTGRGSRSPSPKHNSPTQQKSKKFSSPPRRGEKKREATPPPCLPSPPTPHDGSYSETFDSASRTDNQAHSLKVDEQRVTGKQVSPPKVSSPKAPPARNLGGGAGAAAEEGATSSSTQQQLAIPTQAHHFSVSVDLHSVRDFSVDHSANVFLRYTYPFFGSAAPIITQPPVEVRRGMEVVVPQSFCTFDFATTIPQLQDTFRRIPLVVEVWDKDKNKAQNQLLGVAQVHLSSVLEVETTRAVNPSGIPGTRQVWNGHVMVYTAEGQTQKLGDMNVILSVEDWGPINMQRVVIGGDSTSQALSGSEASQPLRIKQQQHGPQQQHHGPQQQQPQQVAEVPAAQEPRETAEYQAALELEMWKEQQEAIFQAKLKQKEIQHMKALAEEWKKRDKEREVLAKRKEVEYQQLADKLQKRINELEKREKQLSANEQEVLRLKKDLEREHERKMTEMREASRRMKEDFEHQVQLERGKVKELEEYTLRLKTQISEEEVKRKEAEHGFAKYKEQQNTKPEVRLQSEINLLTLEKVELERKLDSVTKSKIHYKQQWGRALKELAKLKQKEQSLAKTQLKKQQQELEHMRLRYLAAEEKEVVKSERQELEAIKNELNHLREQHTHQESESFQPMYPDTENLEAGEDDHITRLIEERDSLLRTGVYTTEDRIITELDRQIRECIARKGRDETKRLLINR